MPLQVTSNLWITNHDCIYLNYIQGGQCEKGWHPLISAKYVFNIGMFSYLILPHLYFTDSQCECGWHALTNNKCIKIFEDTPLTWDAARQACARVNGRLAILTKDELVCSQNI